MTIVTKLKVGSNRPKADGLSCEVYQAEARHNLMELQWPRAFVRTVKGNLGGCYGMERTAYSIAGSVSYVIFDSLVRRLILHTAKMARQMRTTSAIQR